MPRIAAAFGAVATVAFCIGFNINRYPVVWEMLAAADRASQSGESSQPEAASQTESLSDSITASQPEEVIESAVSESAVSESASDESSGGEESSAAELPDDAAPIPCLTTDPTEPADDGSSYDMSAYDTSANDTSASDTSANDASASDTAASDTAASDAAASDAAASDAAASDTAASDTAASDVSAPSYTDAESDPGDTGPTPTGEPSYCSPDTSAAPETSDDQAACGPAEVTPTMKYGSSAADAQSTEPAESEPPAEAGTATVFESERPLVPVVATHGAQHPVGPSDVPSSVASPRATLPPGADRTVRRLPPVDPAQAYSTDMQTSQLPGGPMPIYPSTGIN